MSFAELPIRARLYVGAITATGFVLLAASVLRGAWAAPGWLIVLVVLSAAVHTLKVDIALGASPLTLSIGYVVNFASMLAFGPAATAWVGAAGAWAQCTLWTKAPNPWYRTAFN